MIAQTLNAYPLALVPSAVHTKSVLDASGSDFPLFVHKWTRAPRQYSRRDLYLPDVLDFRGALPDWGRPIVGVGGTRSPSAETFCFVSNVCAYLAERGITLISGGVPGVDLSAHLAAIGVPGGVTLAVLANPVSGGLDGHEWRNAAVQRAILETGGFLSEYESHSAAFGDVFLERLLARDRLISGICDVFVAFECNENSATIDTARRALTQGKRLFGIAPIRRTARRGIDQMSAEDSFKSATVVDGRRYLPIEIARMIEAAAIEAARNRKTPAGKRSLGATSRP